jgi:hypothetical protein
MLRNANKVLGIFELKKEEVIVRWRKLPTLLNIIRMTKSRRMRWMGHAECRGDEKCTQNFSQKTSSKEITQETWGTDGGDNIIKTERGCDGAE